MKAGGVGRRSESAAERGGRGQRGWRGKAVERRVFIHGLHGGLRALSRRFVAAWQAQVQSKAGVRYNQPR